MADQPYDPYIPQGGAGGGASGAPGNQRTAAIQAVGLLYLISFSYVASLHSLDGPLIVCDRGAPFWANNFSRAPQEEPILPRKLAGAEPYEDR